MAVSRTKTVGISTTARLTPGPRGCRFRPQKTGRVRCRVGRLQHPEALEEGDVVRSTASVGYSMPIGKSAWSSTLIWGRNHKTSDHRNGNSFALESVAPVSPKNFITGRIELVDKDDLFDAQPDIKAYLERTAGVSFRIGGYKLGYKCDIDLFRYVETGIGANFTAYTLPPAIQPYYGAHPCDANIYLRFRLRPGE
jgi:hypothetical protein